MESLLEMVGHRLHRNFVMPSEKMPAMTFTLTEPLDMSEGKCDQALQGLLFSRGLRSVPLDVRHGIFEIVSMYGPRGATLLEAAVWKPAEEILASPWGKQIVSTFVPLQHVASLVMTNSLRALTEGSPGSVISGIASDAGIILIGDRDDVARMIWLARESDQPPVDAAERQAAAAQVQALTARVTSLREQLETLTPRVTTDPAPAVAVELTDSGVVPAPATRAPFLLERGEIAVDTLVEKVAAHLHWEIDCTAPDGVEPAPFQIGEPLQLDAAGCEEVLCALLWARGLALVPVGGTQDRFAVLAIAGARGKEVFAAAEPMTAEEVLRRPWRKRVVTTTVTLRDSSGPLMVNALRPLLMTGSWPAKLQLPMQRAAHAITLTGFQDQVANAVRMIQASDVKPACAPSQAELDQQVKSLTRQVADLLAQAAALRKEAGK